MLSYHAPIPYTNTATRGGLSRHCHGQMSCLTLLSLVPVCDSSYRFQAEMRSLRTRSMTGSASASGAGGEDGPSSRPSDKDEVSAIEKFLIKGATLFTQLFPLW